MNSISSIQIYPVHFTNNTSKDTVSATLFSFANGFKLNKIQALVAAQDFSVNNQTGLILTNLLNYNNILYPKSPDINTTATIIESPLALYTTAWTSASAVKTVWDGTYWRVSAINQSASAALVSQENFIFDFNNLEVQIHNPSNLYLSIDQGSVYMAPLNNTLVQSFQYLLGQDNICLFATGSNYTSALVWNQNQLMLSSINPVSSISLSSGVIGLVSQNQIQNQIQLGPNNIITYKTDPTDFNQELEITDNSFNSTYTQNYLFHFALDSLKIQGSLANFELQFHPLKNYQMADGECSTNSPKSNFGNNIHRKYTSIFSGGPTNKGWDKVYLGYTANTVSVNFPTDQVTPFQFNPTNTNIAVSAAGFIENGATAASHPLISDRISIQKTKYTNSIAPSSFDYLDGTWWCTWLSGNGNQSMWMDRFYNAGYFPLTSAINIFGLVERKDPSKPYIWDQPSTLMLEPGVTYQYFHPGIKTSQTLLNTIELDPINSLGTKILHFNNWASIGDIPDQSLYKQTAHLINGNNESVEYLSLDGTKHVSIAPSDLVLPNTNFTVNFWINPLDWNNIEGLQIFGNYDSSGYGLLNTATNQSPLFTLLEQTESKTYTLNYKMGITDVNSLSGNSFEFIQRLPDLSYWVVDNNSKHAYWYDAFQNLILDKEIPLYHIHQVLADQNLNVYMLDNINHQYIKIDYYTGDISTHVTTGWTKSLAVNMNGNIVLSYGIYSVVTTDNVLWEVLNNNLYKSQIVNGSPQNRQFVSILGQCYGISADSANYLYFLLDKSVVVKLNTTTLQFVYNQTIGQNNIVQDRYLGIIRAPIQQSDCDRTIQEMLIIVDNYTKEVFLLNENGILVYYLNLRNLPATQNQTNNTIPSFKLNGDFTGYSISRLLNDNIGLQWKIQATQHNVPISLDAIKNIPAPGWHMFSLILDGYNNTAKSYMDGVLVSTYNNISGVDFKYKSPLLIGAATVQSSTLNAVLGLENVSKFQGKFADLRIYNKVLTTDMLQQLYWNSPVSNIVPPDLKWQMPTGNRNYVEEIQQWFILNPPGHKSKYFNMNIYNFNASAEVKNNIENSIRTNINKFSPAQGQLFKIQWC